MNRLQQFLYGRNGLDQLSAASLILAVIFLIASSATGLALLAVPYLALIIYALFRILSRDIHSRRRENIKFMSAVNVVIVPVRLRFRMLREINTHKYVRCPKCRSWLRVPKGKGRIAISCTRCRDSFIRKV